MKKLFLFGLLGMTCLAGKTHAQWQQGTKYRAATFNLTGEDVNRETDPGIPSSSYVTHFNPSVQLGKFVKENVLIGIGLETSFQIVRYQTEYNNETYKAGQTIFAPSLSPYIRYYKTLSSKWAIFLHSAASATYLRFREFDALQTDYQNGYGAGLQIVPGVSFKISSRFALESDVTLLSLALNYQNMNDVNSFTFNSLATTNIPGFFTIRASWYLQKAK